MLVILLASTIVIPMPTLADEDEESGTWDRTWLGLSIAEILGAAVLYRSTALLTKTIETPESTGLLLILEPMATVLQSQTFLVQLHL